MFHVEKMDVNDFPFAVQLANTMDWNMTEEDFEFMLKLEPEGCFVQFQGDERVGVATSVVFGEVGWFGNFIVNKDVRGKGAGTSLIQNAIDYLRNKGVATIGLYAYPHLVKFYERFGFEADIDFLVLKGKAAFSSQELLKAAERRDVPELVDLDCECFGANRRKLLEPIILDNANLCYVSTGNGEVTGYVAAKVYGKMAELGPLVCCANHVDEAVVLLKTMLSRLNGLEIFAYIPKEEGELLNVLGQAGLKEDFSLVRMFSGPPVTKKCIYTAESLERG
jgi:GNAT superfamily N-acetyltransferase